MAGKFELEKCGNAKFLFNLGELLFVLKARNDEIVGKSEMYASAKAMDGSIASVKANAATAGMADLNA
jgi:uncharacterized protein YegP (UPF0339 family)